MSKKDLYVNGQKKSEQVGDILTYYYKDGTVRAKGPFTEGKMEGEWIFYRNSGQLWQVGNFKNNQKHGRFQRYDKNDELEYDETFENGKLVKKE